MAKKKRHYSGMRKEAAGHQREDSGMIREDRGAPSNMPQRSFIRMYPEADQAGDYKWIDDTLSGTDMEMRDDAQGMKRNRAKSRF